MKVLVTGGAGFIGSNLVAALLDHVDVDAVTIVDNFSTGRWDWIPKRANVIKCNVTDLKQYEINIYDTVIHCQAHSDVRFGAVNLELDFNQNLVTTKYLLGLCKTIKHFIFTSSAVVYGDPAIIPTPETYAGIQTSIYGAHKLACEAMIQAYASYFGFDWHIFRFVSFTGRHYHHGVIADFVRHLKKEPTRLPILGDGNQTKSYLDVQDGVEAMMTVMDKAPSGVFNLGHDETMRVRELANIIIDEMGLTNVSIEPSGGDRGWTGDSPMVKLDCSKVKQLGWRWGISIEQSIRNTVQELLTRDR